jgi:hypothetical protein
MINDFGKLLAQFAERRCRRGHEAREVTEGTEKATRYIDEESLLKTKSAKMKTTDEHTFFLCLQYQVPPQ